MQRGGVGKDHSAAPVSDRPRSVGPGIDNG